MKKLYLVTRADLPLGQQAVQPAHALTEYTLQWPKDFREWYDSSNTLALLTVDSEETLSKLLSDAQRRGIPSAGFHEPDRNNELTAVALGAKAKGLCGRLPLAFAEGDAMRVIAHAHQSPTQEQVPS